MGQAAALSQAQDDDEIELRQQQQNDGMRSERLLMFFGTAHLALTKRDSLSPLSALQIQLRSSVAASQS